MGFRTWSLMSSFIFILFFISAHANSSPVFFWSNKNFPLVPIPLSPISASDLIQNHVCPLETNKIQLHLFSVDDLKIADFHGEHPLLLDAKTGSTNIRFFPACSTNALETLSKITNSKDSKCSHIHFELSSTKTYGAIEYALEAIEKEIKSIGKAHEQTVVIALVSNNFHNQEHSRHRRQAGNGDVRQVLLSADKTCMFYAEKLIWTTQSAESVEVRREYQFDLQTSECQPNASNVVNNIPQAATLKLNWKNSNVTPPVVTLVLTAEVRNLYWYLQQVIFIDETYRYFAYGMQSYMDTPPKYCYACGDATFVRYDPTTHYGTYNFTNQFRLTNLQMQPVYGNAKSFGQVNYCTSFFTSGIWMGLTSSLLLIGILLFGIHRLMTIKSNDRFDDPKGKPLLIKAQE